MALSVSSNQAAQVIAQPLATSEIERSHGPQSWPCIGIFKNIDVHKRPQILMKLVQGQEPSIRIFKNF